ncbi:MAG TPA: hypothetical protein VFG62_02250 [Rhodopila sp.]|nr:hypothetical protein [Rhodopila sp.]
MNARVLGRILLPFCLLMTLFGLSACGDLPEPFLGNPGATARRLAKPPAPLLAVTPGTDTLLTDKANQDLADQMAKALQATEVPAMVRTKPEKTDWRLVTTAKQANNMVSPQFTVVNPDGKEEGKAVGEPVPVAEWASASPQMLQQIAAEAAPRVGAVLTSIRVAHEKADPNSLYNRQAKVMVAEVTGAPGDGNDSLTRQMRARLAVLGPIVLTTPTDADFIVKGKVAVAPLPAHKERVEIQWSVTNPAGDERGKVVQLNEIPAGTLDHYWGDVAVVVAAEASNGVNDVIRRQSDREPASAAQQPPGSASGSAPGSAPGTPPATSPTAPADQAKTPAPMSALPAAKGGAVHPVSARTVVGEPGRDVDAMVHHADGKRHTGSHAVAVRLAKPVAVKSGPVQKATSGKTASKHKSKGPASTS